MFDEALADGAYTATDLLWAVRPDLVFDELPPLEEARITGTRESTVVSSHPARSADT